MKPGDLVKPKWLAELRRNRSDCRTSYGFHPIGVVGKGHVAIVINIVDVPINGGVHIIIGDMLGLLDVSDLEKVC